MTHAMTLLFYSTVDSAARWRAQLERLTGELDIRVLGELGQDAARTLRALGFDVAGWSRSEKTAGGIACHAGTAGLPRLLARSEILVCLLPLTAETEGILNARTLALLPRGAAL